MKSSRPTACALAAIVLLGGALRFYPIWFGLPYLRARPDEETAIGVALSMLGGDLNPHFFHWPSLTFYVFAAVYAVASRAARALALDPVTPAAYIVIGRACVAVAGTLTLVVLYRLGRRVADAATGLLAALLLAVAMLHVRDSHFAMTDVFTTLLVLSSLLLLVRAVDVDPAREPAARWFAAAGLAGGLAASTKYSAAAIVAGMAGAQAVWWGRWGAGAGWLHALSPSLAFAAAFAVGFLAATPYAVLDFPKFETDLRFTVTHLSGGHGVDLGRGWKAHATRSLPYGLGWPTFVAALLGVVPFVRRHPRQAAILGAFAAAFYASLAGGQTVFFRYILPLVPIACLSAAIGVRHAAGWIAARTTLSPRAAAAALTVAVAAPSLVNVVWFDALLARTDTRVLAARWLAGELQSDDSLHDAGGEYSQLDLRHLRFHQWYFDRAAKSFGDPQGRTPDWLVLHESPLRAYAGVPPEIRQLAQQRYVLVQTFTATRGRARSAMYDHQDAFFMPVSGFATVERPGPTILIYRRAGHSAAP